MAKERPIICSAHMVRAILENRQSQTRRVVKPQPVYEPPLGYDVLRAKGRAFSLCPPDRSGPNAPMYEVCPYGVPGDRLWVRERFAFDDSLDHKPPSSEFHRFLCEDGSRIVYHASYDGAIGRLGKWRPSIHMPRWASRITLEVTGVRVERVQEISEHNAKAEGVAPWVNSHGEQSSCWWRDYRFASACGTACPIVSFEGLWDNINAKRGYPWADNPWCWVVEFRRLKEGE